MSLLKCMDKTLILCGGEAKSKSEVLSKISETMLRHEKLKGVDKNNLIASFKERESLGSTAVGHGIALPHCKLEDIDEFVVSVATFPAGVDYDSVDGQPVVVAVAIVGPKDDNKGYIRLLSEVSCFFRDPGNVQKVISAKNPEEIMAIIGSDECKVEGGKSDLEHDLVQVYIRDEEIFDEVVEVFTSFDCMAAVTEVTPLGNYLSKLPLFASFWTERDSSFCRKLSSIIDRKWTNEFIRRIDNIAKGLSSADKICLVVQPVSYVAGSIGI